MRVSFGGNFEFKDDPDNIISCKGNIDSFTKLMELLDECHLERLALDKENSEDDETIRERLRVQIKMQILAELARTSKNPSAELNTMKDALNNSSYSREDMKHLTAFAQAVNEVLISLELH